MGTMIDTYIIILSGILKHRETKQKNGYLFVFQEIILKSSVVSSSGDSEDGNESEIDVLSNPPKKYCSSYF